MLHCSCCAASWRMEVQHVRLSPMEPSPECFVRSSGLEPRHLFNRELGLYCEGYPWSRGSLLFWFQSPDFAAMFLVLWFLEVSLRAFEAPDQSQNRHPRTSSFDCCCLVKHNSMRLSKFKYIDQDIWEPQFVAGILLGLLFGGWWEPFSQRSNIRLGWYQHGTCDCFWTGS